MHIPAARLLFLLLLIAVLVTPLIAQPKTPPGSGYYPTYKPRMVAEWEPAIGVLIAWPLSIPKQLVIDLAADTKLYMMVESQKAKQEAIQYLTKWQIMPDRVKFITAPQGVDASWTRDWGPHAVFTPEDEFRLIDPRYLFATPLMGLSCEDSLQFLYRDDQGRLLLTQAEDQATDFIAASTEFDMVKMPYAFTGGNVANDGQQTAFSTCALVRENEFNGVPEDEFKSGVRRMMGIENYYILSNFEGYGIQHIDCFLKILDEERILVARPPKDHPASPIYEEIVKNELSHLTNAYDRPYQILRIDLVPYKDQELTAYTNSLILNTNVYVPLFGVPEDSVALNTWRDAMPGYRVRGYAFPLTDEGCYREGLKDHYGSIGWDGGDALHCRTRAMWDPNMIYMSVDRIPAVAQKAKSYTINVIIKDYSAGDIESGHRWLKWRIQGEATWKSIPLEPTGLPDQFRAILQGSFAGVTVEYYAEAKSNWGSMARMPMTAPGTAYTFRVN
jgi:agmatine/peptidylarginine deiminase